MTCARRRRVALRVDQLRRTVAAGVLLLLAALCVQLGVTLFDLLARERLLRDAAAQREDGGGDHGEERAYGRRHCVTW